LEDLWLSLPIMPGIILAGGLGTRLGPITKTVSKQLLPVYDKPMIYYPLSLLMASGINEIAIITTPQSQPEFINLLGDGKQWGINLQFIIQNNPNGLPEAFLLCEDFIGKRNSTLILGDNIFYGSGMGSKLKSNSKNLGATMYGYLVNDVSQYGTFQLDGDGNVIYLREKPKSGGRGLAIPGIYHFDSNVSEYSRHLKPSSRGELEIIDLLNIYLQEKKLNYSVLDRGTAWLDTGTIEDLSSASELIRVVQSRQGLLIGSPEEVAFRNGWIESNQLLSLGEAQGNSLYGKALISLYNENYN